VCQISRRLADSTWPEAAAHPRRALVVPVGALEQHGPHLPLDTDTRIAVAVARRAVGERGEVALAPPIAFGASGEHAGFPGTLSIGTAALTAVLVELGRSASADWRAVLFVNGHGGNAEALRDAVATLAYEGRRAAAFHVAPRGADAHAGRAETSMLLALDAAAVREDRAQAGETAPIGALLGRLRAEGVRAVSPNGVLGDPAGASAAEGEALLTAEAVRCAEALAAVLA
jgi:mycofactocin system creatininase family protein